jgi:hypothetical protein
MDEMVETTEGKGGDVLPACEVDEDNTKYFEYREWKGEMCRYYPFAGTYISVEDGKIRANDGGPKNFDGKALAEKRWADRRQAIVDGLSQAAQQEGIGSTPTDMLAEIVKAQAIQATEQTRDGTGAAKFVMGLMEVDQQGKKTDGPAVVVEISAEGVKAILEKLAEDE